MVERPLTPIEERRLKTLTEATPNTWLALDDTQSLCVGRGATIAEAIEEARRNGYEDPIMFLVPPDWTPMILLPCV
jgi:alkanesulfonate monooxygenase SsuD/methylene tetrahydromethanopterin reductase-like flavin-dependent oxidoreductase (luciferase family)